ncbi:MAG TPA: PepSY domain-containing protein [Bacillaceae bacterium]
MKHKALILGAAGLILFGGAMGAGALSDSTAKANNGVESERISMEDASDIAIKAAGGKVESIELEKEHGRLVYDIDMSEQSDDDDVEVKVDAVTGEIIKLEKDRDHDDDRHVSNMEVTKEQAIQIALADSPGKVVETEFDKDDACYEIEIKTDSGEVELKIDAHSGKIVEKDTDHDDNDDRDDD